MSERGKPVAVGAPPNEADRLAQLRSYQILDTLPELAFDDITFLASEICECPIALISLVDEDRQWFKSRVGLQATETSRDVAFCARAILEPDELLVVPDATQDERFASNPLVTTDPLIRFYAGAPLTTSQGDALGTLCVIDRVARELDPSQMQALSALSRQVMAQLELRKALVELEQYIEQRSSYERHLNRYQEELEKTNASLALQSVTDSLTGLHNRRALLETLDAECERARRYSHPLTLAILDVDHFKSYNDAFGHPIGDRALEQIAGILTQSKRNGDLVARHGGEEFAIVLPETDLEGARLAAERVRKSVESADWPHRRLTISVGIAVLEPHMADTSELLGSADQALYRAKQEGRNRVSVAATREPDTTSGGGVESR